jgi:chemotaxis response regulator CheB
VDGADNIRVLLAEIPSMMCDIVREAVAHEPDMVVVGEGADRDGVLGALAAQRADVVIIGTSDPEQAALPFKLLERSPGVKILMLAMNGRRAMMYELRSHQTPLADVSPRRLVDAIRSGSTSDGWKDHK